MDENVTPAATAEHAELVDHRQIGRIGDDDHERPAVTPVRDEAVAQHQVRRNRTEQLLVDPEVVHVDELEPVPLGKLARARDLRRIVLRGLNEVGWIHGRHVYPPMTELSSKSGMYSARTTAAITTPMMTRITGSMIVMNRLTSVSISSS